MKLVIVSHTEHFKKDGKYFGWGPTIKEINALSDHFDEIVHIAVLHAGEPPNSCLSYSNNSIRFIPIKPFGGESLSKKISIFRTLPRVISLIKKEHTANSWMQVRLPTGIGVLLLPYLYISKLGKNTWYKYAGNWNQDNAPLGYRIQKWWLNSGLLKSKVTINGKWPDQKEHLISFENPCLTNKQVSTGLGVMRNKIFSPPFNFVFIGKLFRSKGVLDVIEGLSSIPKEWINNIRIIGEGDVELEAKTLADQLNLDVKFEGFQPSDKVHSILQDSHFILLPSRSEGFPKVLAEGATYGAIPIASAVGAVAHFFKDEQNAFIWFPNEETFVERIKRIPFEDSSKLTEMSENSHTVARRFTFEHYINRIQQEIIK